MTASKNSSKKVKQHTVYKTSDGKRVPGVTTILGIMGKPALIPWANRLGLEGVEYRAYLNERADIGTCCHAMIEADLKGVPFERYEYSDLVLNQAETGYLKWLEWKEGKDIEVLASEMPLVSEVHRYGGTCDIYALVNGVKTLIDIKTGGSGVYPDMKTQVVGGYLPLLEENGYRVDQAMILRVSCDETSGHEEAVIGNWDEHKKVFLLCRELYEAVKVAK